MLILNVSRPPRELFRDLAVKRVRRFDVAVEPGSNLDQGIGSRLPYSTGHQALRKFHQVLQSLAVRSFQIWFFIPTTFAGSLMRSGRYQERITMVYSIQVSPLFGLSIVHLVSAAVRDKRHESRNAVFT